MTHYFVFDGTIQFNKSLNNEIRNQIVRNLEEHMITDHRFESFKVISSLDDGKENLLISYEGNCTSDIDSEYVAKFLKYKLIPILKENNIGVSGAIEWSEEDYPDYFGMLEIINGKVFGREGIKTYGELYPYFKD